MKKFALVSLLTMLFGVAVMAQTDDYPINHNKTSNRGGAANRKVATLKLTSSAYGEQTVSNSSDLIYRSILGWGEGFEAKSGESVTSDFVAGSWIHGFVYLDRGNDGSFDVAPINSAADFLSTEDDLLAFSAAGTKLNGLEGDSYYNMSGTVLSSANSTDIPSYNMPALADGFYRMRYKVDWSSVDPAGTPYTETEDNDTYEVGGSFFDIRLHVHGDNVSLSSVATHGSVCAADGTSLPATAEFGEPYTIKLVADAGHKLSKITVRYGYCFDGDATVHGMEQWKEIEVLAAEIGADGTYELSADVMKADVRITAEFVEEGTPPVEPELQGKLDRSRWTLAASSWNPDGTDGTINGIKDGKTDTYWHSQYNGEESERGKGKVMPQWFTIDLGKEETIAGFDLLPRQDNANGICLSYKFFVSNTPFSTLETPAKTEEKLNAVNDITEGLVKEGTMADDRTLKTVEFDTPCKGRYVLFVYTDAHGDTYGKHACLAEFNLYDSFNDGGSTSSFESILAENDGLVYLYSNVSNGSNNYLAAIPYSDKDADDQVVPVNGNNVKCEDNSGAYSFIWRFEAKGNGYTLRSMYTGQWLKGPIGNDKEVTVVNSSSAATTYYVKASEVEGCTDRFVISSTSTFDEGTCLFYASGEIESGHDTSDHSAWKIVAADDMFKLEDLEGMLPQMPDVTEPSGALAEILEANDGLVRLSYTFPSTRGEFTRYAGQSENKLQAGEYNESSNAQVWQIEAAAGGYTLRSLSSAKYVSAISDLATSLSDSPLTLYIKESEVDGFTDCFVISSSSDFSGSTCLTGDSQGNWDVVCGSKDTRYAAWRIEPALGFDTGGMGVSTKYYKIENKNFGGNYITESWSGKDMTSEATNKPAMQIWKFTESEGKTTIQSVSSKLYIQGDDGENAVFRLGTEPVNFVLEKDGTNTYSICAEGSTRGLGEDMTSHRVVSSEIVDNDGNSKPASRWFLHNETLSAEDIAGYEAQYQQDFGVYTSDEAAAAFFAFFEDAAATQLKSEYQNMDIVQLQTAVSHLPSEWQAIIIKVRMNSWANDGWEKEFRVAEYGVFSDPVYWDKQLNTLQYNSVNNPTGIVADNGDKVFIIVGDDIPADATLKAEARCTENISYCSINPSSIIPQVFTLKKGMNVLLCTTDKSHVYINYTSKDGDLIANYPKLNIHVEGGSVQGYVDIKKHTDADWVSMQSAGLFTYDTELNLLGNYAQLYIPTNYATQNGNQILPLIELFDWYVYTDLDLMGITAAPAELKDLSGADAYEDIYPKKVNNRLLCLGTHYGTLHGEDGHICLGSGAGVFKYTNYQDRSSNIWGSVHEYGHINQDAINLFGAREVSNNLFSNVALYKGGNCTSRGDNLNLMQQRWRDGAHNWPAILSGETFHGVQMWYQLYLYYHAAGNDPFFYQKLFRLLREDPIVEISNNPRGTDDYLKFALKACEAAGEDLTDFFEYWGFFEPVAPTNGTIGMTTTQADIDAVKAQMASYPKKGNAAMMFIEDRAVVSYKANGGGVKDGFLSVSDCVTDLPGAQYSAFTGEKIYPDPMSYTRSGNNITINNTAGAAGIMFYDASGKLAYVASANNIEIPSTISVDYSKTKVALTDGTTIPLYNTADNLYLLRIYDSTGETYDRYTKEGENIKLAGARDGENAVAQLLSKTGGTPANVPTSLRQADNVAIDNTFYCLKVTDKKNFRAWQNASALSADNVIYTRTNTAGYNSVCLPFTLRLSDLPAGSKIEVLHSCTGEDGNETLWFDDTVKELEAGKPCLVWCPDDTPWNITISDSREVVANPVDAISTDGSFTMKGSFTNYTIGADKYKLNNDGSQFGRTTAAGKITAFRVWMEAPSNGANSINIKHGGVATDIDSPVTLRPESGIVYDLQGRPVAVPEKGRIYIKNGRTVLIK